MLTWLKKPYQWMGSSIDSPYADHILCFLFYLEAIFFLPTDPILILFCLARRDRAIRYATIATIGSVLGGITSYYIGTALWSYYGEQIIHNGTINYILTPSRFYRLSELFKQHEWGAIMTAGFTPIPYKAATLAAGFCNISIQALIVGSIVSRGARFYLLAAACIIFGERINGSVEKYFNLILLATAILIMLSAWLFT